MKIPKNIQLKQLSFTNMEQETCVVFVAKQEKLDKSEGGKKSKTETTPTVATKALDKMIEHKVNEAVEQKLIHGSALETIFFRDFSHDRFQHLLVVGLGDATTISGESVRQAVGAAIKVIKREKVKSVGIAADTVSSYLKNPSEVGTAIAEALVLANYRFDDFKEKPKKEKDPETHYVVFSAKLSAKLEDGFSAGLIIGEAANFARWLGDNPGNIMTPTRLARETQTAAKGSKLRVTVWDKARIKRERMGSFLSVSLGSSEDPRFIIMEYKGGPTTQKPIAYVGKGLTFDSGGISIKPSASMEEMKFDMCGGAAVIATMLAIAQLKLKVNAVAYIPATENMPGPAANKPGDIVTARNNKTIEINNTDAEGRLILADALVYACEQKPAQIVSAATLTGAIVIALGNIHTGVFSRDENLRNKITDASEKSGEWLWHMPLVDYHVADMKGTYADLSNTSSTRGAGSATAAAFLEQFVDKKIPYAHFDIAGTAWNVSNRLNYLLSKGASGVMVRTFVELARTAAATK